MPPEILIADDDSTMRRLYSRVLSGQDYTVTFADSAATAKTLIETRHFDLLVTDLMLGDGLGTDLARLFSEKFSGARSLLVTGSAQNPGAMDLAAVSECLGKPLDTDRFMLSVAKALAQTA
ncbi:MAG: hypothetical protein A2234_08315 [Elusimicrobia bacterium RIFOXYA2_FULL_58_8]|nr:MAG: hypothetical protein A2285_07175 [Elusimicrobia bacterium RIFOXYA12_FULL_57_11]OGS17077.1 MAG: hypothetical protein A2234_08315 [Elusimicrobia bacterium RIFOXYA2_FULL_58_8]